MMACTAITPSFQCLGELLTTESIAGVCILRLEERQRIVMAVAAKALHKIQCLNVLDLAIPICVCQMKQVILMHSGLLLVPVLNLGKNVPLLVLSRTILVCIRKRGHILPLVHLRFRDPKLAPELPKRDTVVLASIVDLHIIDICRACYTSPENE